jgi:two-component system OmpR family sensor kinase
MIRRFHSLPVRWRLALTSAGLTFAILLLFAVVIGVTSARQLRSDFDDELRLAAADVQQELRVRSPLVGEPRFEAPREVLDAAAAGNAAIRVVSADGDVLAQTESAPVLGPPSEGVRDEGHYRVVSRPLFSRLLGPPAAFVQYGRPRESLNDTIARLRLFLGLGVLAGTALALLAGLAVARRAMGPIAALTRAAKGITRTRDPGVRLPQPVAEDEVADLARTLEEMLMALDAARSETEAALGRQREFVADASHELRTPLTSILANLELLEGDLEGEDREIASSALRSSRRMRRLVADLLLLARADAGRRAPREPTDAGDALREAVAEVAPVAGDRALAVDTEPGLVVEAAPDDLHRLALNLIENAVAHTPPGTSVRALARRAGDTAVIDVSDDGPGVPEGLGERVFERFVHGSGSADGARGAGSGLGLAIVRAVAETHGGTVELGRSQEGGARFVVRLPLAGVPDQTSTTTGSTIGRRLSRS